MTLPFSTVRDLLRFAVTRFNQAELSFGHGSSNAYDEAAYLILHSLHLPLDLLDPFLDAKLTATEVDAILRVIERRAAWFAARKDAGFPAAQPRARSEVGDGAGRLA